MNYYCKLIATNNSSSEIKERIGKPCICLLAGSRIVMNFGDKQHEGFEWSTSQVISIDYANPCYFIKTKHSIYVLADSANYDFEYCLDEAHYKLLKSLK